MLCSRANGPSIWTNTSSATLSATEPQHRPVVCELGSFPPESRPVHILSFPMASEKKSQQLANGRRKLEEFRRKKAAAAAAAAAKKTEATATAKVAPAATLSSGVEAAAAEEEDKARVLETPPATSAFSTKYTSGL